MVRQLKKNLPVPWKISEAKEFLRDDIVNGLVDEDLEDELVYGMHLEYSQYKFANFKTNLKNLLAAIRRDWGRMEKDLSDYQHDLASVMARRGPPNPATLPWHKTPCKMLLQQDVDEGKHLTMKPKELWETRTEYKLFSLATFRNHIYQEVDSRSKKKWRMDKKKKKLEDSRKKWKSFYEPEE